MEMVKTIYVFYGLMMHLFNDAINCLKPISRVVFGATSSPFLLNPVIHKHVRKWEFMLNLYRKFWSPFFVDDCSGEANTIEEAFEATFSEGSFNLPKWRTNDSNLREHIGIKIGQTLKPTKIFVIPRFFKI